MANQPKLASAASERDEEAPLTDAEREFRFVYLDTEPLRAAAWPKLRAAASTVATLAHEVGITVCLPEPVEAELAAQFMRAFGEADGKVTAAWRDVERVYARVDAAPEGTAHRPTAGHARTAYDAAVAATCKAHKLQRTPRSKRALDEYFDLALNQSTPFDAEGRGFKDAVILMSVIDDLCRRDPPRGLLVTRDKDFKDAEAVAKQQHVGLIVRNGEQAVSILRRRLDVTRRSLYTAGEQQALALAEENRVQLDDYIGEKLEVPHWVLAARDEQLLRFVGFDSIVVIGVQADPPFGAQEVGAAVTFTYTMQLRLVAEVMPIPETIVSPTMVTAGNEVAQTIENKDTIVQQLAARSMRRLKRVPCVVELDAKAIKSSDGFTNLTPVAVRRGELSKLDMNKWGEWLRSSPGRELSFGEFVG